MYNIFAKYQWGSNDSQYCTFLASPPAALNAINRINIIASDLNNIYFFLQHGTCPVCRRYYCPGELHLPPERISLFRSIIRRVYHTLRSPFVYFFPSLGLIHAANDGRRSTPMYRLIRAERVTSLQEPVQNESDEMIEDYIFCHVMFVLQNVNREPYPGSPNTIAANMRRRFSRLDQEANVNPAAGQNPLPENPEFNFPSDVLSADYLGHYQHPTEPCSQYSPINGRAQRSSNISSYDIIILSR